MDPFGQASFILVLTQLLLIAPAVATIPAPAGELPRPPASRAAGADAALAGAPSRGSPQHPSGFIPLGSPARAPPQAELRLGTRFPAAAARDPPALPGCKGTDLTRLRRRVLRDSDPPWGWHPGQCRTSVAGALTDSSCRSRLINHRNLRGRLHWLERKRKSCSFC